jgi:chemotaxis protein methyltransferase CheR
VDAYCQALFDDGLLESEYQHVVDLVTTNKTDFFREPDHFDFLAEVAVPQLLAGRGRADRLLKVWSAAASTGAEAYTIAMVLAELARGTQPGLGFRVLGTDISTQVLETARRAIYSAEMMEPVPARTAAALRAAAPRSRAGGTAASRPSLRARRRVPPIST